MAYSAIVIPFMLAGVGMALFFAPMASVVLGSVGRSHAGQASGANNAIRELGGVFGVAVLASIFTHEGGYGSAQMFTDGITPALWVGAAVVGSGSGRRSVHPRTPRHQRGIRHGRDRRRGRCLISRNALGE